MRSTNSHETARNRRLGSSYFSISATVGQQFCQSLREDYTAAEISEPDRVMLDYVSQLTRDATRVLEEHHQRLRAVGFDDRAILQITLISSWFNYINRVADALGVGRS